MSSNRPKEGTRRQKMSSSPYAPAAKILNEIWTRRKGLKTVVYSKEGELKCSTSTYAICCHVLKQKSLLTKLLKKVPKIQAKNQGLVYILLYELLMGPNKKIRGGGALKRQIMSQIDVLQENFKKISEEEGWIDEHDATTSGTSPKTKSSIPRYVRINTLVADRDEVLETIKAKTEVYIDPHIPDLLVLDHTSQSRALLQDLVISQKVILQDKSSCFSALCMVHGFVGDKKKNDIFFDYLDACAAPGNKTSHLAALVHNLQSSDDVNCNSTIHALDKDSDRYKLLNRRISSLVPQGIVHCHKQDFFEVSKQKFEENEQLEDSKKVIKVDEKFKNIQAIMLDPSCSGSGMTSNHTEKSLSRDPFFCNDRIKTLSNFQYQALYHATTDFPKVDCVVYSTCSLYVQENEGVVQRLLASNVDWELCPPLCLKNWHRRGLCIDKEDESNNNDSFVSLTEDQAKCLIRVHPDEDGTNGFFVACFQRKMKPRKNSSPKNNPGIKINVPNGMELYKGQFYSQVKYREAKPSADTQKTEALSIDATKNNDGTSDAKRKINQISITTTATAGDGAPNNNLAKKISKKRAKKMEWKKRQRLQKEARLKAQIKPKKSE